MDADAWFDCYDRLVRAFGRKPDTEQSKVYFEALSSVPTPVMRLAIRDVIRDEKRWPNVGTLRVYCTAAKSITIPEPSCPTCSGNLWVEAQAEVHQGVTYVNVVRRCPTCRPSKQAAA